MNELVSVIMPVHNASRFIAKAIESVVQQDWPYWELLVVDNGCTDDSMQIVRSFFDQRIIIFTEINRGAGYARNTALENMKGDYFCFLDADDCLPAKSISARIQLFHNNNQLEFVDGYVEFMNEKMTRIRNLFQPAFYGNPFLELVSLNASCYCGITWMIKKIQGKVYRFNSSMTHAEDLAFYLSLCNEGEYDFVKECTYRVRRGHRSAVTDLRGLESGYEKIYHHILTLENLPEGQDEFLRKKIRSIMSKSFLKNAQPLMALKAWRKFSAHTQAADDPLTNKS